MAITKSERIKSVALTTLKVVGLVVASIVVLAGAAMFLLQTDWGSERLRRKVVGTANEKIQGRLDIGRLSFGGNKLQLWNIALRDPEGQPVAQVARVEVNFRLLRLLRKEIRLSAIVIESPHLTMVSDARGLNVSRATAPRKKAPEEPPKEKTTEEGLVVQLDRFDLTGGLVTFATPAGAATDDATDNATDPALKQRVHLADLVSFISARYATGNGALDMTFRLNGQSKATPVGPFGFVAEAHANDAATRFSMDGDLLGGSIKARGNMPAEGLEQLAADVKVAIPKQDWAGFDWGPVRVDGQAVPGSIPKLDLLLAIPGIELSGKTSNASASNFDFNGRLNFADLALTGKAVHALAGGEQPSVAGQGLLTFAVGGPMKAAPSNWSTSWTGQFDRLRFAENVISGLSIDGRVTPLVNPPKEVDFKLAIATVTAGTSALGKIKVEAKLRQQDVTAEAQVASPQQTTLTLAGRLDDDQQGFALKGLTLVYPQAQWALEKTALMRFGGDTMSLTTLALISKEQRLAMDGSKTKEQIRAHLSVDNLRLDLLPTVAVDPALRLAGTLDVDVKAEGEVGNPKVAAKVVLKNGRFQGFSRLFAKIDATLADQIIDGAVSMEAPFTAVEGRVKLPMDPLAPGAPLDVRFDMTRLDLGDALRAAAVAAPADGRVNSKMHLTGSADNPKLDVTVTAKDLTVRAPAPATAATTPATTKAATTTKTTATATTATSTAKAAAANPPTPGAPGNKAGAVIDVGQARIHLTYARRSAGLNVDFNASHGGSLKVDADAKVDLSYPRVTRGIVAAKIPVRGKVVAKDFDVAWIARFNERLETLAGQVNADAKLAGTVGDPQFVGDVRWKNGKVVATVPPKPAAEPKQPVRR